MGVLGSRCVLVRMTLAVQQEPHRLCRPLGGGGVPGHVRRVGHEVLLVPADGGVLAMQERADGPVEVAFGEVDLPVARPDVAVGPQQPRRLVPGHRVGLEADAVATVQLAARDPVGRQRRGARQLRHRRGDPVQAARGVEVELQHAVGHRAHPRAVVGPVLARVLEGRRVGPPRRRDRRRELPEGHVGREVVGEHLLEAGQVGARDRLTRRVGRRRDARPEGRAGAPGHRRDRVAARTDLPLVGGVRREAGDLLVQRDLRRRPADRAVQRAGRPGAGARPAPAPLVLARRRRPAVALAVRVERGGPGGHVGDRVRAAGAPSRQAAGHQQARGHDEASRPRAPGGAEHGPRRTPGNPVRLRDRARSVRSRDLAGADRRRRSRSFTPGAASPRAARRSRRPARGAGACPG